MKPIRILDAKTVNQIAAGEVVERPASVVKELVENALDAGAQSITVEIQEGGLKLIKVTDDGSGMDPEDARRAVENHATSKISSVEDLGSLRSFGFRGEALASLAAVSHFELTTRVDSQDTGYCLRVRGGGAVEGTPAPRPRGTTVSVSNLFFNTPARLKFMKKTGTENDRAALVVTTYALAFPGTAFQLTVDGRRILDSAPGTPESRRRDVFGKDLAKHLLPVSHQAGPLQVSGAVTEPAVTKSTRESLFFFVNKRWVMNPSLSHAVMTAYQTLLPTRRFPAGTLFLDLPTEAVDVNIHPTKREVKFAQDRTVYDALVQAVRRTLLDSPLGPSAEASSRGGALGVPGSYQTPAPAGGGAPQPVPFPETPYGVLRQGPLAQAAEPMPTGLWEAPSGSPPSDLPFAQLTQGLGHQAPAALEMNARRIDPTVPLYQFSQFFNTFIVFQSDSELFIADQHTVHERLNFEKILDQWKRRQVEVQPLLVPITFDLPPREAQNLTGCLEILAGLGLEVEPFGGNTFIVKAVPSDLSGKDPASVVRDLADQIAQEESTGVQGERRIEQIRRRAAAFMSCRSAVMAGDRLNEDQMRGLIDRMRKENIPFTCPHGRPTLMSIPLTDLYRRFDRH